jgi:hypothetical protein
MDWISVEGAAYVYSLMDGAAIEEVEGGRLTEKNFELRGEMLKSKYALVG